MEYILLSRIRYGIALFGSVRTTEEDPLSKTMQELQIKLNNINTMRFLANKKIADRITIEDLRERTKIPSVNQIAAEAILMKVFNAMRSQIANRITIKDFQERTKISSVNQIAAEAILTYGSFQCNEKPNTFCG